jgi:uncharacterized protein YkwD
MTSKLCRGLACYALLGGTLAVAGASVQAQSCTPRPLVASADENVERTVLQMINAERAARNLPAFASAPALTQAARRHSTDMATRNFFSHDGSDKSDFSLRITAACYPFRSAAENIAAGYGGDLKAMVKGWMDSPLHRESILSVEYSEVGVGYALNKSSVFTHYWTMEFGQPSTAVNSPAAAVPTFTPAPRVKPRPKLKPTARPVATARLTPRSTATPRR